MMRGFNNWQTESNYLVAIQYGDVKMCAALLAAGADADQMFQINSVTRPALSLGVERGAYSLVELLLKNGVAINRRDSRGNTALHIAVEMGYERITKLLLRYKADVNAGDNCLVTPLHIAAKRGALGIMSNLIEYGSDVNKQDQNGKAALSHACSSPKVNCAVVKLLLDNGASADDLDTSGYTPLHLTLASVNYDFETIELLVNQGVRLNLVTRNGNAPISKVILSNNPRKWRCLNLLLKNGCDMNVCNQMGQSPVHIACLMSDIDSLRILLRANADVNTVDRLGISPIGYCITNGLERFAQLLIDGGAKVDLNRLSLHRLKESFRQDLYKRTRNPLSLKALAKLSMCKTLKPNLDEWIEQNRTEFPKTLVPFLRFEESDY